MVNVVNAVQWHYLVDKVGAGDGRGSPRLVFNDYHKLFCLLVCYLSVILILVAKRFIVLGTSLPNDKTVEAVYEARVSLDAESWITVS